MSDSRDFKTVIAGEASESEEDEEPIKNHAASVVVCGEASESDEEEPIEQTTADVPPLKVEKPKDATTAGKPVSKVTKKPKSESLLHKKLREKNSSLHAHLVDILGSLYVTSAKEVKVISNNLSKSQAEIQEVSHSMRLLTNDLFHLEDKIDIVASCTILPDINITPLPQGPSPRGSPAK